MSPPPGPLASPIITVGLPPNVTSTALSDLMAEKLIEFSLTVWRLCLWFVSERKNGFQRVWCLHRLPMYLLRYYLAHQICWLFRPPRVGQILLLSALLVDVIVVIAAIGTTMHIIPHMSSYLFLSPAAVITTITPTAISIIIFVVIIPSSSLYLSS